MGTGLQNDNIKFQIETLLDNPDVTDEMLIEKLNEASNLKIQRLNNLKRTNPKTTKITATQLIPDQGRQDDSLKCNPW